jgi:hypothetical protein
LATNLQQDKDLMEKINHLYGHCENNKGLIRSILLQCWRKFSHNFFYLNDKIIKGEFVELPCRLQTKMQTFEANQELQILNYKVIGKKSFFSTCYAH